MSNQEEPIERDEEEEGVSRAPLVAPPSLLELTLSSAAEERDTRRRRMMMTTIPRWMKGRGKRQREEALKKGSPYELAEEDEDPWQLYR